MHRNPGLRFVATGLLAVALLVPLAGCALQAVESGPTVLKVAYRPAVADLGPLLKQYERENPGITIEPFELTGSNFPSLRSELDNGTMDVVREYRYTLASLTREGVFEPLDSWIESVTGGKVYNDYFSGVWESLQTNGQQYGVPAGLDMYVAFANLTAFQNAGVEPPNEDWTLDDLLTKAAAVSQLQGTPGEDQDIVYGFGTYYMSADPILFTYLHGELWWIAENPTTFYMNDPRTVEAVTFYTDLVTKYKVSLKPTLVSAYFRSGGIYTAASQGYCALWFGLFSTRGGGGESLFGSGSEWDFDWKMLPLPHDAQQISMGDADGYYIPANSAHQQEAMKLVRWLADQWQASGVRFQVRKSLAANESYQAQIGAEAARIGALAAENLVVMPEFYGRRGGSILSSFFSAVYQIQEKGDDPQMVLDQAQQEMNEALLRGDFNREKETVEP